MIDYLMHVGVDTQFWISTKLLAKFDPFFDILLMVMVED